jgi:hypothetical protein
MGLPKIFTTEKTFFRISVRAQSVFSVVRKYVTLSFSHSRRIKAQLMKKIGGLRAAPSVGEPNCKAVVKPRYDNQGDNSGIDSWRHDVNFYSKSNY